jgi:PAS domain S-box-containing protein/diguanylate cyclase (GGDEF)-like protein
MPASLLEHLAGIRVGGTTTAGALESVTRFTARLLGAPLSLITVQDGGSFSASASGDERWQARLEAPLSRTLCRIPAATGQPLLIADARVHPLVRGEPGLWRGEVAYAGVPIRGGDGGVSGTLCAIDAQPREWSGEEVAMLEELAGFAALLLDRRAAAGAEAAFVGSLGPARGRLSLRMLEKAVETMQIGVTITDLQGRILYTNPAEAAMHGYALDELRGQHARIFAPQEHARPMPGELLEDAGSWSRETVNVRKDGSVFPVLLRSDVVKDSRGRTVGLVTCCEDISQRRELERQLLRNAFYDSVTGLPNRGLFSHRLDLAVDRERRGEADFAVILVGVGRLQLVADSLGHGAADGLLSAVARRVARCVGGDAMLAHVSRDEFAVLLDDIEGIAEPSRVAGCILEALERPCMVQGTEVFTGASVGMTLSYTGYDQAEDVLRDAAIALNRAHDGRHGHYEVFDRDMHAQVVERLRLETDLRRALERGELRVFYQPIVALPSGRIAGFEALVRWQHPQRGLMVPDDFVPLAEETGLILPIGMWVLEEACRELSRWQQHGDPVQSALTMAVNLSAGQFLQADLVDRVARVLRDTGIAPHTLKLEITESVLMEDTETVTETLHRLKALGVQLHIDDFGTGFSSLAYLHRLPLDALKIDRSFLNDPAGANLPLVRSIVALAHGLGVAVVTEGIESSELLGELRSLNCEFGQGFLFSRPLSSLDLKALFETDPRW